MGEGETLGGSFFAEGGLTGGFIGGVFGASVGFVGLDYGFFSAGLVSGALGEGDGEALEAVSL